MFSDLKHAARSLLKTPGFTAIAILTLALGIGAVTAVFSLLSSVLLRPPPYPNAERLVVPFSVNAQEGMDIPHIGLADYQDWRREKVFERLAVFEDLGRTLALSDEAGEPEQVRTITVSDDYFAVLGIPKALLGRTFSSEEYRLAFNVVLPCILSYELWQRRYRGDSHIVGRNTRVDGSPCLVVGVMPQGALWPANTDIVQPINGNMIDAAATNPEARKSDLLLSTGIARLKPDSSLEQTNAVLAAIAKRTELHYPQYRKGWSNRAVSLHEVIVGKQARTSLLMAMAAVCCLLAIAVINVAGLLLARGIARRQEMQIRAALGAGRWQLTRHLLAESTALALSGGALGLLLAVGTLHLLSTLSLPGAPPLPRAHVDSGMLSFALGISMLTAALCGLAPLAHVLRRELNPARSRSGATGGMRMLNGLIVAEITLSVLLLAGAGLLIRSFIAIQHIDPGFQSERLLTFAATIPVTMQPGSTQIPEHNREQTLSIFRDLTTRLENTPGVLSTAVSSALPSGGGGEYFTVFLRREDRAQSSAGPDYSAMMNVVGAGFFNTLGIRRMAGRDFDSRDTPDSTPVIIINEALARRAFPNQNPIGKRIRSGWEDFREIVGVVGNVRYLGREDELRALAYVPHAQWSYPSMMLSVRTVGDPSAAFALVRSYIKKTNLRLVVSEAKTMTDILDRSVAPRRSGMTISAVLAGAAMLLAAIGLYGALSYTVAQRTKELGIRMALGARPGNVLGLIVGQGLWLTLTGVALGLAGALLLTSLMTHLLYEVSATDPITFVSIAVLLTGVGLAACYLPARRATKVDPLVALRAE